MSVTSSFFNERSTRTILSFVGKIPVTSDWLMIRVSGLTRAGERNFINLSEIPLWPEELLEARADTHFEVTL